MRELIEYVPDELLSLDYPVICIIDSGLDWQVWEYIAERFGIEAARRITYYFVSYDGEVHGPYFYDELSRVSGMVYDASPIKHGSTIVYLLKSLSPNIKLVVVHAEFPGIASVIAALDHLDIEKHDYLLDEIIVYWEGPDSDAYIHPQIISLSLGTNYTDIPELEANLSSLVQKYDYLVIFAASGNHHKNELEYPARYDSTYAVGSVYDTTTKPGYVPGQKCDFSNYGPELFISAPGYNLTTARYNPIKDTVEPVIVSGTSYSTPIVALVYAYLFQAAKLIEIKTGYRFSREDLIQALKLAAENIPGNDLTSQPAINSPLTFTPAWDEYNGWGCVDAYDSVNFLGLLRCVLLRILLDCILVWLLLIFV